MRRLINWLFDKETHDGCGASADRYMSRWRLLALSNGRRLYLHHFLGDDWSPDMHDHPKAFFSIGLWGSYVEERPLIFESDLPVPPGGVGVPSPECGIIRDTYRAPWIRRFPPHHIHRLVEAKGCWTLVYTGPTVRPWGFWRGKMWVPWQRYVETYGGDEC